MNYTDTTIAEEFLSWGVAANSSTGWEGVTIVGTARSRVCNPAGGFKYKESRDDWL